MSGTTVLEGRALSKRYGPVIAVDAVDIEIRSGEILGLIGDNGAGKSTVVGLLSGAIQPDDGQIIYKGDPIAFESPRAARSQGIETVFQDLALCSNLDVASNLYLGRELVRKWAFLPFRVLDQIEMVRGAVAELRALRISVPSAYGLPIERLSGGQRQAVAVGRSAAWASAVLFLDEPTAALGVGQKRAVLQTARHAADSGIAVVLISHSLPEVLEFADRLVVMRRGRNVADMKTSDANQEGLIGLMVGG